MFFFFQVSCFVCHANVDDIEKHFLTAHQIPLTTMNTIKQCCLCGFHCDLKTSNLFEHQLRTHAGVCYSSTLKQFIRFEPPPPPLSRTIITKNNNRLSSHQRALTTHTDKVKSPNSKKEKRIFEFIYLFFISTEIRLSKMCYQ